MTSLLELEQELKSAQRRADSLVESSPLAVIEWSSVDRRIVRWSKEATRVFGWSADEAIGKSVAELGWLHPDDRPRVEQTMAELFTGQRSRSVTLDRNFRKDRSVIYCEWYQSTLPDGPDGFSILSQVLDVTERRRAEEALRENESLLRAAFDNLPFDFWVRDEKSVCIMRNPATSKWGELLGLRPEDASVPAAVLANWLDNNRRAFAGEVVRSEVEYVVNGERHQYDCIVAPIPLGDRVRGILGFNIDITQRKRAEEALLESERKLREALNVGRMGYLDWNLITDEIRWSPETYRLFGYDPDGGFTPTIESTVGMVPPEDRDFVSARLDAVIKGTEDYDIDHRMVRLDGRVIHVHAQGEVVRDPEGKPLRMLGTVVDITDRKRAEQELREADRSKNEFLGVLSHELRNPLTPIRNSLHVLERTRPGEEQHRRAFAIIERQVGHLARLVDDLLDVTRITRGKIHLQRTRLDLVEVVQRTVEDHRSLFEMRELIVEVPKEPIWIDGDPTRLAQVVGNLLSNAAKFTPTDGRVTVSLTARQGVAQLEIADSGIGIDTDTLERLFEPFVQADRSLDRSRGGLGLGLALVKGLIKLHGGEVNAQSDGPGRGARFTVRLPLDESAARTRNSQLLQAANKTSRRVLVIEDNKDAADSLLDVLVLAGHQVAVAYNGRTGLEKARALEPQIVLCDLGLPGELDGYAVARALRQDPAGAKIFLVALTGYALPEDQQRARDAGFDAHIAKPPDLLALVRFLSERPL